jgi:hypothetical protein
MTKAVALIATDNGDDLLSIYTADKRPLSAHVESRLRAGARGKAAYELEEIEQFLAGLDDDTLETLCTGEETERIAIGAPAVVQEFLERAFEGFADE